MRSRCYASSLTEICLSNIIYRLYLAHFLFITLYKIIRTLDPFSIQAFLYYSTSHTINHLSSFPLFILFYEVIMLTIQLAIFILLKMQSC